jgi:1-phosphatidylinositol-4-phosphate 5-kinase
VLPEHIRSSLSTDANRESVFKAKESAGKSGSFFFFSYDRRFIIKTMNNAELNLFKKALPDYFFHCRKYRNSLIARIYGIFTV